MHDTRIELVLRIGAEFREIRVPVDASEHLLKELSEPLEWSDDPLYLMMASPGMYGGFGDAITIRKKVFSMREATAKEISWKITEALVAYFGRNDRNKNDNETPTASLGSQG